MLQSCELCRGTRAAPVYRVASQPGGVQRRLGRWRAVGAGVSGSGVYAQRTALKLGESASCSKRLLPFSWGPVESSITRVCNRNPLFRNSSGALQPSLAFTLTMTQTSPSCSLTRCAGDCTLTNVQEYGHCRDVRTLLIGQAEWLLITAVRLMNCMSQFAGRCRSVAATCTTAEAGASADGAHLKGLCLHGSSGSGIYVRRDCVGSVAWRR